MEVLKQVKMVIKTYPVYPNKLHVSWDSSEGEDTVSLLYDESNIIYSITVYNKLGVDIYETDFLGYTKKNRLLVRVNDKTVPIFNDLPKREYLICKEIVRKETLRFNKIVGVPCKVYKKKVGGTPCTACIDEYTDMIIKRDCEVCKGTRFIGGYYDSVSMYLQIEEAPIQHSKDTSTIEHKNASIRLTNILLVSIGDIIVDTTTNTHWEITQEPQISSYRLFPVVQQVHCASIAPKRITLNS